MATREEVQKKINEARERMSDEELDQVAGGTFYETEDVLAAMGNVNPEGIMMFLQRWDQDRFMLGFHMKRIVEGTFEDVGINVEFEPGDGRITPNKYKIDGKSVTHQQFINFLNNSAGIMSGGNDW